MNEQRETLCRSPEWATLLQDEVIAPLVSGLELGDELLELDLDRGRRPSG